MTDGVMPGVSKEIQRRIKSIRATRKITKAMELVAVAKMRKSQAAVLSCRPYVQTAWEVVKNVTGKVDPRINPLLEGYSSDVGKNSKQLQNTKVLDSAPLRSDNSKGKALIILIASDKGLCGSLNAQVCGKALEFIKKHEPHNSPFSYVRLRRTSADRQPSLTLREGDEKNPPLKVRGDRGVMNLRYEFITIGKKARAWARRLGLSVIADFMNMDSIVRAVEIRSIAKIILDDFTGGTYESVYMVYTHCISTLKQVPRVKKVLPVEAGMDTELGSLGSADNSVILEPRRSGGAIGSPGKRRDSIASALPPLQNDASYEFLFEPSPELVLNAILPKLVTLQIYQAILESNASEHSARMVAMKNATDAAGDMLIDLSLAFNQARQASITQEIAEIATAIAAMGG